ncbi:MAG: NAD(P)-dependent alcohol dehydrogenase [Actinomycetota bacterium]
MSTTEIPDSTSAGPSPRPTRDATVPDTMSAVVGERYGAPEELRVDTIAVPAPGPDQVVLRVAGASTNALDWHLVTAQPFFVRAMLGIRRPKQPTPGNDVSGTVVAVGSNVTSRQIGEEVFGNCWRGACAEYAVASANQLELVPTGVDVAESSTVGVAAFTALQAVRDHGEIGAGDRVVIIGASSGVGVFAIQLAVAAGAEVTAVTSTANLDLARSLGAHHVVDRTTTDPVAAVVGGQVAPYDVVLDLAGALPPRKILPALTERGRFVLVGGRKTGHLWPLVTMPALAIRSRLSKRTLRVFTASETPEDRVVLAAKLADGSLRPVIGERIGLDGVARAIRSHGDRTAVAKILVQP